MAINGIVTAREARVVAGEIERIASNLTMFLLMESLRGTDVSLAAKLVKGINAFGQDVLSAAEGKRDADEVFETESMKTKIAEGEVAAKEYFGGFGG